MNEHLADFDRYSDQAVEMLVNLLSAYGTLKFIGRDHLKQWVYLTFIRER